MAVVVPSPTPRRLTPPRWLDLRLVLGIVLVLVAVIVGATVVSHADSSSPVVVATRDLTPGTVLSGQDLALEQVRLPADGAGVYLPSTGLAVGRQVSHPIAAGELLPVAALSRAAARTTLTIPFQAGTAPDLRAGQRIEVWLSSDTCSSVVLLDGVAVQDAHTDTSGSFTSGATGQDVVVSVEPDLAQRVVTALSIDQGQIRAGVLSGGDTAAAPTSADRLPSLAACTATSAAGTVRR